MINKALCCQPHFFIIGAAKAGTTSLYMDLAKHPSIFLCNPKEPEFFCRDEVYGKGIDWYLRLFGDAGQSQICGEASTQYSNRSRFPLTVERIKKHAACARFIYVVREPCARAYSYWVQLVKNQQNFGGDTEVPLDFRSAWGVRPDIVDGSDYPYQLQPYLDTFGSEAIHVVVFEELVVQYERVMSELCSFLGIDLGPLMAGNRSHANESSRHFASRARSNLADALKTHWIIRNGRRFLPVGVRQQVLGLAMKSPLGRRYVKEVELQPMDPQTRKELGEKYRPIVEWMETYLGRDLCEWREAAEASS